MATRDYWAVFGSGAPSTKSGLAPTFITFVNGLGSNVTPPAVTEPGTKGLYKFAYDATQTIAFTLDGATTGLPSADRYVSGVLEAQDTFGITLNAVMAVGQSLAAQGSTNALILTFIGATNASIGSTSADPTSLFGFMRRAQEFMEGNQTYTKATGILDFFSRGSSTLLIEKTISDTSSTTTKT